MTVETLTWLEQKRPLMWEPPALQTNIKRPAEVRQATFDFTNFTTDLAGTSLSTVVGLAFVGSLNDLVLYGQTISGNQVQFNIRGGTDGLVYTLFCTVMTGLGAFLQANGNLYVTNS